MWGVEQSLVDVGTVVGCWCCNSLWSILEQSAVLQESLVAFGRILCVGSLDGVGTVDIVITVLLGAGTMVGRCWDSCGFSVLEQCLVGIGTAGGVVKVLCR